MNKTMTSLLTLGAGA
ncbi:DUF3918 family protein, partial [Bacillus atrophaeus]